MVKNRTFTLLMVFVFLFSWCLTNIQHGFANNLRHVLIYENRTEVIDQYRISGFQIIETYQSFFLTQIDDQQETFLKNNKVNYSHISGIGSIRFNGYEFKPDTRKNIIYPQELKGFVGQYTLEEEAIFLLQFIGPVKNEWIAELNPNQYMLYPISDFAYLVKTTGNLASSLRSKREVSMIDFLPSILKISPELKALTPGTVNLEIITSIDFNLKHFLNNHQISEKNANYSTIGKLGFLELKTQHTSRLAEFCLNSRIIGISNKFDIKAFNAEAAQVVRIRDANHANIVPYTGAGQIVAVADSGLSTGDFETLHQSFQDANVRIAGTFSYPEVAGNNDWADNSIQHGTHVSGTVLGNDGTNYKGMAPEARLVIQSIKIPGNPSGLATPSFATLFGDAYGTGARIHTNSWGSFGDGANNYLSSSAAIDAYQWEYKDFSVIFAAGNSGPGSGTLSTQSNAKNNIVVGGTQNNKAGLDPNRVYTSSSRGPTPDNRIKPDVAAPAQQVRSTTDTNTYRTASGTSMAAPVVAGSMALLREKYGNVTSALLKAFLINGTMERGLVDQGGTERICPNMIFGWGRIDVEKSTDIGLRFWDVTGPNGLTTGQTFSTNLSVYDATKPLKITLVYTDAPGTIGAEKALVNDLDLLARSPSGKVYRGNLFNSSGYSITPAVTTDDRNNVEGILIPDPEIGDYQLEVIAKSVTQGEYTTGRQPFAMVSSGSFDDPGPNPEPLIPSFILEIMPSMREVVQGDFTTYQAVITSINGAKGWVHLKPILFGGGFGDPSNVGISHTFYPSNQAYLHAGSSISLMIRVNTSNDTPLSVYPMTAIAELDEETVGILGALKEFSMNVIHEPTFNLNLRPNHATIYQDETTYTQVNVQPRFDFNEPVAFEVVGLPPDTTFTMNPNPTSSSIAHEYRSVLTIQTQKTAPAGIYDVMIIGSAELPSGKFIERNIIFRLEILPRVSNNKVEVYRRSIPDSVQAPCKENDNSNIVVKYRIQIKNIGNEKLLRNRIEIRLDPNLELISSEPSGFLSDGILKIDLYDLNEPKDSRPGDCWPTRDCNSIGYPGLSDNDGHYLVIYARLSSSATKISSSTLLENRLTYVSDPYYTEMFPFYTMLHPCPGAENPLYFRAYVENLNPDGTISLNSEVRVRFKIEGGSGNYTYTWNWSDGTVLNDQVLDSNEVVLKHTYQKAGVYRVLIQAKDSNGRFKKGEIILRIK